MISKKINYICIIEDKIDFNIMYKKFNFKNNLFLPLNLETFLLCKKHNTSIFNFEKFLTKQFHIKAINETKRFINKLRFKNKISFSLKLEVINVLRRRLYSTIFILEIIECLLKNYQIKNLVVSGHESMSHDLGIKNYKIASEIIKNIYPKLTLSINKKIYQNHNLNLFQYNFKKINLKKKAILISNLGYNFNRINSYFRKLNYDIFLPVFNQISLKQKIIYFFRGVNIIQFYKYNKKRIVEENIIKNINFIYKDKYDLSFVLNSFNKKLKFYFNDLGQKISSLKILVQRIRFKLSISNIARGLEGSIINAGIKFNTLCIPHGIISNYFNNNDKIYKKIISEGILSKESKYIAIQSKIINSALKKYKLKNKKIITGNLIFSQKKIKKNKKKYILYAPTLKNFLNIQYLGVELFFEFWKTLDELNFIAQKKNEIIVVKIHPQFKSLSSNLAKEFKFLKFMNDNISKLLEQASSLITLSSGTIEDALNSRVPVILYDRNNRYKQMLIHRTYKKDSAIYYINSKKKT